MAALRPGDVLVRVRATGLCHTDLEVIAGHAGLPAADRARARGRRHRRGGRAARDLGEAGRPRRLLVEPALRPLLLLRARPADPVRALHAPSAAGPSARRRVAAAASTARKLHHFSVVSSHAEYCVVPESGAIVVPKEIPFDRACLIGCGVMTGVGAAAALARVDGGSSVAVIGCGAVGLNAVQGAVLQRADTIIAIDRDPARLAMAHAVRRDACRSMPAATTLSARSRRSPAGAAPTTCSRRPVTSRPSVSRPRSVRPGGQAGLARQDQRRPRRRLPLGRADGREADRPLELRRRAAAARFPLAGALYLDGKLEARRADHAAHAAGARSTRASPP